MSYCRHNGNDSDVYVYPNIYGGIVCVCTSQGEVFDKRSLLIEHLKSHLDSGDKVPERVFNRLEKEIGDFFVLNSDKESTYEVTHFMVIEEPNDENTNQAS